MPEQPHVAALPVNKAWIALLTSKTVINKQMDDSNTAILLRESFTKLSSDLPRRIGIDVNAACALVLQVPARCSSSHEVVGFC